MVYAVTGDRCYREIVDCLLAKFIASRNYLIGKSSIDENWITPPNQLSRTMAWTNANGSLQSQNKQSWLPDC